MTAEEMRESYTDEQWAYLKRLYKEIYRNPEFSINGGIKQTVIDDVFIQLGLNDDDFADWVL